jgi:hypothetical protein
MTSSLNLAPQDFKPPKGCGGIWRDILRATQTLYTFNVAGARDNRPYSADIKRNIESTREDFKKDIRTLREEYTNRCGGPPPIPRPLKSESIDLDKEGFPLAPTGSRHFKPGTSYAMSAGPSTASSAVSAPLTREQLRRELELEIGPGRLAELKQSVQVQQRAAGITPESIREHEESVSIARKAAAIGGLAVLVTLSPSIAAWLLGGAVVGGRVFAKSPEDTGPKPKGQ